MYKHPGVYIEHVPSGLLAIEAASTSIAAFIGPVKRGKVGEEIAISNAGQFEEEFGVLGGGAGGIRNEGNAPDRFGYAVNAFFANGGTQARIFRVAEGAVLASIAIPNPGPPGGRAFEITAKNEGRWGNALQVRLRPTDPGSAPDLELGYTLEIGIEQDGAFATLETFPDLSMESASGQFIEQVVNDSSRLVNMKSALIADVGGSVTAAGLRGNSIAFDNPVAFDTESGKALVGGKVLDIQVGEGAPVKVRFEKDTADLRALARHIQDSIRAGNSASPDFTAQIDVDLVGHHLQLVSGLLGVPGKVAAPVTVEAQAAADAAAAEATATGAPAAEKRAEADTLQEAATAAAANAAAAADAAAPKVTAAEAAAKIAADARAKADALQEEATAAATTATDADTAADAAEAANAGDAAEKRAAAETAQEAADDAAEAAEAADTVATELEEVATAAAAAANTAAAAATELEDAATAAAAAANTAAADATQLEAAAAAALAVARAAIPAAQILGLVGAPAFEFPVRTLTNGGVIKAWLTGGEDGEPDPDVSHYNEAYTTLRDSRDVSIILLPTLNWIEGGDNAIIENAVTHCEFMKNRMVIVDPPDTRARANRIVTPKDVKKLGTPKSTYTALYYPWLDVSNPHYDPDTAANLPKTFSVPPSAFAAGMWARIDGRRGVWKAPAGLEATVRGTLGPNVVIGNELQDNLNDLGVNCLRAIVGPTVIWGARTLATKTKPEFRYVPIRRTQNMIGESLYDALQAVVFEPNDPRLWASLRASVGNFMDQLHRAGAFQGEKASDAYRVSCGLNSTMTQPDVDAGVVRVVVEFAPLKPAEFVVVQIKQIVGRPA